MIRSRGFTLFEILIAVFIFAILGTLAGLTLHTVIKTHGRLSTIDKALMAIQVGEVLIRRDISQIIDRPITRANGMTQQAVMSYQNNGIIFTAFGRRDPNFIEKASYLVRIAYVQQGDQLVREVWPVLDPTANTSTPTPKVVFTGVQNFQIQYVDQNNRLVNYWPEQNQSYASNSKRKPQSLPKAIMVTLTLKRWGRMQRMIDLAGATRRVEVVNG